MHRMNICRYQITSLSAFLNSHTSSTHTDRLLTPERRSAVLLSNSNNIFDNLATEEALLRGVVLSPRQQCLFIYVNAPCVVIGRNQNCFQEVALRSARRDGISIARRTSGGGAVYHDAGNVCLSFLTHRAGYSPAKTIQFLRLFLSAYCGMDPKRLSTTGRHDLFLDGKKISGSAMRVQRDVAYHHCTLLLDACRERLGAYLQPEGEYVEFKTSAVHSVRSPVTTLSHEGVLPRRVGSAVTHTSEALALYFVRHAETILTHSAPWEMAPPALTPAHAAEGGEKWEAMHDPIRVLDTQSAVLANTTIMDGEGRRPPAGAPLGVREESARLQSTQWLFSMPKFDTRIAISSSDICGVCDRRTCEAMTQLVPEGAQMHVTTGVEQSVITSLAVFFLFHRGDTEKVSEGGCWCEPILKTLLEGVSIKEITALRENDALLTAALQLECRELMNSVGENGDVILLQFLNAVMKVWSEKNVFS